MLCLLQKRRQHLEGENAAEQRQLVADFLTQVRRRKQESLDELTKQLDVIDTDLSSLLTSCSSTSDGSSLVIGALRVGETSAVVPNAADEIDTASNNGISDNNESRNILATEESANSRPLTTIASRRKMIHQHFDELEQCYFTEP